MHLLLSQFSPSLSNPLPFELDADAGRHAWTSGEAERFVQTLKDALEGMLRKKRYRTIAEQQAGLDRRLAWYNIQRPHQGRHNRGRPPLQVIREFRPGKKRRYSEK